MARGRTPLKDSYIINLDQMIFEIACAEQPSKGTEVDIVIPVKHNGDDFLERCIFLFNKTCYQMKPGKCEPLECTTMRRNFYIYDGFPRGQKEYEVGQMTDEFGLMYFYRIYRADNSAFRR